MPVGKAKSRARRRAASPPRHEAPAAETARQSRAGRWRRPDESRARLTAVLYGAAVVTVTFAVFGAVAGHDFVLWDDTIEIYQNGFFNPPSWSHLGYLWTHPYLAQYVPVTDTVWSLLASIAQLPQPDPKLTNTGAGFDPHPFHALSLLLHLVNAGLAFSILRALVGRDLPAAAGALLFAVHPTQVESVAWASELRGLLAACFVLASVGLYVAHVRSGRRVWLGLALGAAALAMLSKPSAVALPLLLPVVDHWLLGRSWRTVLRSSAGFFVLTAPFLLLAVFAQPVERQLVTPLWLRPFVAGDALAFYLAKLVIPLDLGIDYGRSPLLVARSWWGYLTWLLPAAVVVLVWVWRKRAPWLVAAALLALAPLLPVLGIVPFAFQHYATVADRYLYVPLFGLGLGLAAGLARLEGGRAQAAVTLSAVALVAYAGVAFWQAGYWASTEPLMRQAIAVNPRSDVAYNNLGIILGRTGRLDEARTTLEQALRLKPDRYDSWSNLGNVMLLQHKTGEAITDYRKSIALKADWDESHSNLASALASQAHWQEAVDEFRVALRLNPNSAKAKAGLERALAAQASG